MLLASLTSSCAQYMQRLTSFYWHGSEHHQPQCRQRMFFHLSIIVQGEEFLLVGLILRVALPERCNRATRLFTLIPLSH